MTWQVYVLVVFVVEKEAMWSVWPASTGKSQCRPLGFWSQAMPPASEKHDFFPSFALGLFHLTTRKSTFPFYKEALIRATWFSAHCHLIIDYWESPRTINLPPLVIIVLPTTTPSHQPLLQAGG
jgi:hypothetical protein